MTGTAVLWRSLAEKRPLCTLLAVLVLSASLVQAQSTAPRGFGEQLNRLMDGGIDSLAVDGLGTISAVQFDAPDWAFFNAHEREGLEDGHVPLHRFQPLVTEDVVELRDRLTVVLLHERQGWKVRLATFTLEGQPIQSFLLHDRYGYLYEKNHRAYSLDDPVHYNEAEGTFDFYQLMYGYEPIPTLEQPSQDPVEHQSFHQVAVNGEGFIELRYSETTGKRMFHRSKEPPIQHEVEFHELSLFTLHHAGEPESALWPETHLTHGDMDSHDTIAIPLSYGADWQRRSFFLKPRDSYSIANVAQRHENVMTFPGDGTTCELTEWKRYTSPWSDLHCEEGFFQTETLNPGDDARFLSYTKEELQAAFSAVCGSGDVLPGSPEPSPRHARVVVERVVIRIQFEGPYGSGLKYLILHIPHSC